jgi:deoxycytidylate deaminase
MNSRPCEHCINLMREIGIKTVSYSGDNDNMITEHVADMDDTQHTSIGYKYLKHRLYPDRYGDPKLERQKEQAREREINYKNTRRW